MTAKESIANTTLELASYTTEEFIHRRIATLRQCAELIEATQPEVARALYMVCGDLHLYLYTIQPGEEPQES